MRVQRKGRGCKRIRGELLAGEHPAVQERRNGWSRTSGPTGKEAFGVSLWDNKESAEAYNRGSYVDVTRILSKVVEGNGAG